MPPGAVEAHRAALVGYHDLDHKPGFKIDLRRVDDRWYCYLGHLWHHGWSILDVTDPTDPHLERFVEGPQNTVTKQIQVADGLMIAGLEKPPDGVGPVDGPLGDPTRPFETGAYLFDVTNDPTDPTLVGHYNPGGAGTHRNFYAGGDHAYMCTRPPGFEDADGPNPVKNTILTVVDVTDPTAPDEVARWMWPGQHPDDDDDPICGYFHGPAYADGARAYLSYGQVGAVTLDVADPTDPTLVNVLNAPNGLGAYNGVHSYIPIPGTDLACVNSEAIGEASHLDPGGDPLFYTWLVDISDERDPGWDGNRHRGPRVVSTMPHPVPDDDAPYDSYYDKPGWYGPHNQHHPRGEPERLHTSDLLFMAYLNAGLRVYDISDPLMPREAAHWVPEPPTERISNSRPSHGTTADGLGAQFEDIAVDARGNVYCTDPNQGLFIIQTDLV